jgi:indolepyruvate ferredoxin oxidoreductase beta subunit
MKTQMILAGVGGQGILFSSKIFSELGLKLRLKVVGSEIHGMSQRGGSVLAHLKLGAFYSPLIRTGTADFLYSFEKNETYNALKFIKKGGVCFVNLPSEDRFQPKIIDYLKTKQIEFKAFDASEEAIKTGSIRVANIVLIGYSVGTGLVPFQERDLKSVLRAVSRQGDLEKNLRAFRAGLRAGKSA